MRTTIEIDDALMAEAQKASGNRNKKQTVEEALHLMVRLRGQQEAVLLSENSAGAAISLAVTTDERPGDRCRQLRLESARE